ncbi:glycosyltransferase [Vibrio furnissii]|uniref:glycosyltransferase n=1 Tax=Vibrio furnissii TaxID=29494 RepID=UPI001EEAF9C6|nr:glycosyltransferase [Vibrio furnissii]MCG6232994.1 glycosyltransferase [Vibrio furnissii]MCG6258798.1 glycosyltransferase [Vibrio furnissii]
MSNPKVLIVIPTYNGRDYISETIESCLEQDYNNIDILVIDDNSTDDTLDVLSKFGDSIEVIYNDINLGLPKNINKGVLSKESDFFIYLGHDDKLPKSHVSKMIGCFEHNTVAVHCNSWLIDSNSNIIKQSKNDDLQIKKTNNILNELTINNFISVVGMMHRTSAFKAISGWDESYNLYGEWLYYIRLCSQGVIKYSRDSSAYYRVHDTNVSSSLYSRGRNVSFYKYKTHCRFKAFKQSLNLCILPKLVYVQVKELLFHIRMYR